MTEPITYQLIMTTFNLAPAQVKGLLQREPKIRPIERMKTGHSIYPPDTLEKIAARLMDYKPIKHTSPKVPDIIKQLGARGAAEQAKLKDAARLQAALERRKPDVFPPPPAGTCAHPGCTRKATIGQSCSDPRHYTTRSRPAQPAVHGKCSKCGTVTALGPAGVCVDVTACQGIDI